MLEVKQSVRSKDLCGSWWIINMVLMFKYCQILFYTFFHSSDNLLSCYHFVSLCFFFFPLFNFNLYTKSPINLKILFTLCETQHGFRKGRLAFVHSLFQYNISLLRVTFSFMFVWCRLYIRCPSIRYFRDSTVFESRPLLFLLVRRKAYMFRL